MFTFDLTVQELKYVHSYRFPFVLIALTGKSTTALENQPKSVEYSGRR